MQTDIATSPMRIGVVGCGMLAAGVHIPNIAHHPHLRLEWLCDLDEARTRALAEQHGATHVTTNYHDVLNDPSVEMVLLATTHALRQEFIIAAARKGKAVYVEKPMASSPREIGQILKAVRECQIPFCVGHNRRSAPATRDAVEILQRLRANPQLTPWRLDRNSFLRPHLPEEEQTMVLLRINDDILSWKPWAFEEGIILAETTHFCDLANLFVGRAPRRIYATGTTRANFSMTIDYDDGSIATITGSAVGTLDYPKELIEITAHGAMIAIDHLSEIRVRGIEGEPFRRTYPSPDPRVKSANTGIEAFHDAAQQTIDERMQGLSKEVFLGGPDKGHLAHLERFARSIRGDGSSPCGELEGAKATIMTLKAIESCRLGLPVHIGVEEYQIIAL